MRQDLAGEPGCFERCSGFIGEVGALPVWLRPTAVHVEEIFLHSRLRDIGRI